jgi:hypothetical protein
MHSSRSAVSRVLPVEEGPLVMRCRWAAPLVVHLSFDITWTKLQHHDGQLYADNPAWHTRPRLDALVQVRGFTSLAGGPLQRAWLEQPTSSTA